MKTIIKLKRAYEKAEKSDGFRILVDRLWPRGMSKAKEHLNVWTKEIAPSNALRKWYSHDVTKWKEFEKKYAQELKENKEILEAFKKLIKQHSVVTFVYGSKDEEHNNAVALKKIVGK